MHPLGIISVFSSAVKLQELRVGWPHATALTRLAPPARPTLSLNQWQRQAPAHTTSPKTLTAVASRLRTGEMEKVPITVAATTMPVAGPTLLWHSVRLSVMHMLNVLDSTCVIPVVAARTGSRDLSILSQARATTATARTEHTRG